MQVHWNEIQGNPLLQGLHPLMLSKQGHIVHRIGLMIGESRYNQKMPLEVVFDRNFVMKYFATMIFAKLQITEWNTFQALASDAWKLYKSGDEVDNKPVKP